MASTAGGRAHTRTLPSAAPVIRCWPLSQVSVVTGPGSGSVATGAAVATSHSWAEPSLLPSASSDPSGLNATALIQLVAPLNWPVGCGRAGLVTSHSQTVLSLLPAASVRPSGLNATENTTSAGPLRLGSAAGRIFAPGPFAPDRVQRATVPPEVPAASSVPAGLNATVCT